jgi:hypothetical protein
MSAKLAKRRSSVSQGSRITNVANEEFRSTNISFVS